MITVFAEKPLASPGCAGIFMADFTSFFSNESFEDEYLYSPWGQISQVVPCFDHSAVQWPHCTEFPR